MVDAGNVPEKAQSGRCGGKWWWWWCKWCFAKSRNVTTDACSSSLSARSPVDHTHTRLRHWRFGSVTINYSSKINIIDISFSFFIASIDWDSSSHSCFFFFAHQALTLHFNADSELSGLHDQCLYAHPTGNHGLTTGERHFQIALEKGYIQHQLTK